MGKIVNIDYSFTNANWLRKDPNPAGYKKSKDKKKNESLTSDSFKIKTLSKLKER